MEKNIERGEDSYRNREKGRGLRTKRPFFSLLPLVEQRRGAGSPTAPGPAASGCDGGHGEGKRERESRWVDSPT